MASESISVPPLDENTDHEDITTVRSSSATQAQDISSQGKKRQRASKACAPCNRRKTRCDVSQTGQPCTKCREAGRDCLLTQTKRGKYDRSRMYAARSTSPSTTPPNVSPQAIETLVPPSATVNSTASLSVNGSNTSSYNDQRHLPALNSFFSETASLSAPQKPFAQVLASAGGSAEPLANPISANAFSTPAAPPSTGHNPFYSILPSQSAPSLPLSSASMPQLSPNQSSAPLQQTDDLSFAFNFGDNDLTSLSVPKKSVTLTNAPHPAQEPPSESTGDSSAWTDLMALPLERLDDAHTSQDVMYAGDLFTLSHLLRQHWKSQDSGKVSQHRLHFPSGPSEPNEIAGIAQDQQQIQLQYLAQIGCFTLPPKHTLDRMISAYFNFFHPVYPILSRARFYQQYETVLSGGVPMLMLWGMLYVSSTLCTLEDLKLAGFRNRFEALRSFCVRGKALYNASYERDKVNVVIFEFLLSQIWSEGEDSFLWSGRAATTAQSMGMHRTTANSKLVTEDRRLWRRVWWGVFIRDRHAAAATGRPYRINEEFNDIELPEREDFDTEDAYLRFYHSVKLAKLVSKVVECKMIVNKDYEDIQRVICYQGFTEWLNNLPRQLSASHAPTDIFTAFLHISYHCWVIHLFRPGSDDEENSAVASQSAAAATRLFEDLLQQGRVGQGPQFTVTCLFAAMAQHVVDRRCSTGTMKTLCTHRLAVCKLASKELAAMRPVAAWFRRMFRSLDSKTPDVERSPKVAPTEVANFLSIPDGVAFPNQTQPLGATESGLPSAMFADFFWGLPTENPDNEAIDWLFDNS